MIHKLSYILFICLLPSYIIGQFDTNKQILGPSAGFSFLGSTIQVGINHESGVLIRDLGIDEPGKLGVGGIFRYWSYSEIFPNVEWNYTDILLGLQINYHFSMLNENVDPWFGFIVAYDFGFSKSKIKIDSFPVGEESYAGLWVGANAGMRYWVTDNMAFSIRIGLGTRGYGALDLGLDYKFD